VQPAGDPFGSPQNQRANNHHHDPGSSIVKRDSQAHQGENDANRRGRESADDSLKPRHAQELDVVRTLEIRLQALQQRRQAFDTSMLKN